MSLERSLLLGARVSMVRPAPPRVVVVSENPETVDGLQSYFVGVGIDAQSAASLDATANLPERTTAIVCFPDGLAVDDVIRRVLALRRRRPGLLLLLVTRDPRRYTTALAAECNTPSFVVLPRPAFGWAIVDAIRFHAETLATEDHA